jgi:hypothetical protein
MSPQANPTLDSIEELGKMNDALRRGVDLLVDLTAVDAFLSCGPQKSCEAVKSVG